MKKHEINLQITRPITFTTWSPLHKKKEYNVVVDMEVIIREFAIWLLNNLENIDMSKFKISFGEIDHREG